MKQKMLAAAAICVCLFQGAQAADLEVPPAPVVVAPSWTGFYIGADTGGSLGVGSGVDSAVFTTPSLVGFAGGPTTLFSDSVRHAAPGWVLGGQLGYNWQLESWVVGVEADWQWALQQDTVHTGCTSPGTIPFVGIFGTAFGQCLTDQQRLTNFGTARARGGMLVNQWLWYVTGGLAWGTVRDSYTFGGTCTPDIFQCGAGGGQPGPFLPGSTAFSHTRIGWTIGTGVETKLWGNWSVKLEYLYVDLGTISDEFGVAPNAAFLAQFGGAAFAAGSAGAVAISSHVTDHIVRVGVNYKL
jgi:outer membrane immunogenic protein